MSTASRDRRLASLPAAARCAVERAATRQALHAAERLLADGAEPIAVARAALRIGGVAGLALVEGLRALRANDGLDATTSATLEAAAEGATSTVERAVPAPEHGHAPLSHTQRAILARTLARLVAEVPDLQAPEATDSRSPAP